MACGCPVVASSMAAIHEICGDAALYFDPSSVNNLKEQVIAVLESGSLTSRLRAVGLIHSVSYSWRKVAMNILQTIKTLAPA